VQVSVNAMWSAAPEDNRVMGVAKIGHRKEPAKTRTTQWALGISGGWFAAF
jgi:hypothetical protein